MKQLFSILALSAACTATSNAALIAYWNFNESSGTLTDSSATGPATDFSVTRGTSLTYGAPSLSAGTYGAISVTNASAFGTALSSTAGSLASTSSAELLLSNNFTVMTWFNAATLSGTQRFITAPLSTGNGCWGLGLAGDKLQLTKGGVADVTSTVSLGALTNTWNHMAVTVSSTGGVSFYLNGNLLDTVANTGNLNTGRTGNFAVFGAADPATGQYFNGSLDEMKIYDTVLTQGQIISAAVPVPEASTYGIAGGILALGIVLVARRKRS